MTTGEWIRRRERELDDGEDRVKATHGEGEFELVGSMADARSDFKWPETSIRQFRGRSGGANIACI